jgi:hypothetical protein
MIGDDRQHLGSCWDTVTNLHRSHTQGLYSSKLSGPWPQALGRPQAACQARAMYIDVNTPTGDLRITEEELPTLTDAEIAEYVLPARQVLHELFARGRELMRGKTESDRVRPVAGQTLDGDWTIHLVKYSPVSDPLMVIPLKGARDH